MKPDPPPGRPRQRKRWGFQGFFPGPHRRGGGRRGSCERMEPVRKILMVGNPNVGKSALFNRLTGSYVIVSNYPGTTVAVSSGRMRHEGVEYSVAVSYTHLRAHET